MQLTVSLIQTNLFWKDKAKNLAMLQQKIQALQGKTQLVVLPEMFNTGFTTQANEFAETIDGTTVQWMLALAQKHKLIIAGSIIIKHNNTYFNQFIWAQPNGQIATYNKRHLFSLGGENCSFSAGNTKTIVQVNGLAIKPQICYDLRFPVWARQESTNAENMYHVLLYVANWPKKRIYAFEQLLIARAIENQCYVVAVNCMNIEDDGFEYNGNSLVISPSGQILYKNNATQDVCTITLTAAYIKKVQRLFPFYKDADSFNIKS